MLNTDSPLSMDCALIKQIERLEAENRLLTLDLEKTRESVAALTRKLAQVKTLSRCDFLLCRYRAEEKVREIRDDIEKLEQEIFENASNQDKEKLFHNLDVRKSYTDDLDYWEALVERLKNVREKMHIEMVNQLTGGEEGKSNEEIK